VLVDVETAAGDIGTDKTWWGIASTDAAEPADAPTRPMQATVEALLAPRCIDEDADDIEGVVVSSLPIGRRVAATAASS
jgi:hypothetical protein